MQPEHKAHHGTAVERCSIGRPCAQKCAAVLIEKGFVIGERMIGARPGNHPQPDTGSRGFLEWQVARLGFRQGGLDMRDEGFDWQGLAARRWLYEHQIWIKPAVQWFVKGKHTSCQACDYQKTGNHKAYPTVQTHQQRTQTSWQNRAPRS